MARLNRNTTTGAITQPAGSAGCVSETGAGPCADGHALHGPVVGGGQRRREERLRRLGRQQRRGAPQPQHDHRGDHPARRERRLHQRDGGGAVRRRPWARRPAVGGGQRRREERLRRLVDSDAVARLNRNTTTGAITQPAGSAGCVSETGAGPCADGHGLNGPSRVAVSAGREERLRRLARQQRRGAPQPQHDHRGDHPARRERRLRQRDGGGALRRRPWAQRPGSVAVSADGKSVYVASGSSTATPWRASTATRPPGRSPSPPGPPAASSETGSGPCADGHGLDGRAGGGGQRRREERLRRLRPTATPWRASTATRPPGRSPSPPGPPAASARRGRGRAPTAMGSTARTRWRSAPTGRASTSPPRSSDAVARFNRAP